MQRRRRYVSQFALTLLWPLFRYSHSGDAHVLRIFGYWHGPVLKLERRRTQRAYVGQDRRGDVALS
ncbi:MAG TPA: hypothetical protein VHV75_01480 [Solirubrobacteraceae bacterium]|nr:hypothetical protein [Solirubrobacteraceae bacterium]